MSTNSGHYRFLICCTWISQLFALSVLPFICHTRTHTFFVVIYESMNFCLFVILQNINRDNSFNVCWRARHAKLCCYLNAKIAVLTVVQTCHLCPLNHRVNRARPKFGVDTPRQTRVISSPLPSCCNVMNCEQRVITITRTGNDMLPLIALRTTTAVII